MLFNFQLSTQKEELINITKEVEEAVRESGINEGLCVIFCPHTTAAITINETADDDVSSDFTVGIGRAIPEMPDLHHDDDNFNAHLKSSSVGASETVIISGGKLLLGTWQGLYFCEFDGPRTRKFYVKIIGG